MLKLITLLLVLNNDFSKVKEYLWKYIVSGYTGFYERFK